MWVERLRGAGQDSFLFPYHKVGLAGNSRVPVLCDVDLSRPMGSLAQGVAASLWSRRRALQTP